jgi:AAA+ superfamily predicted ATPase
MAKASQIKSLIQSHYENDTDRFDTISLQLAAHEAKSGHTALANELKKIVDKSKQNKDLDKSNIQFHSNSIDELFIHNRPNLDMNDLILTIDQKEKIEKILKEYFNQDKLRGYGLKNRRKVLLSGHPGTGKTMTASVIAAELHLPIYIIQIDKIITKYMGETSAKLRQIFKFIESHKAVYFFDEFDSIGGDRSRDNEVGEMRRVLNAFLQFLEGDQSDSLIITATNNISLLDKALFRRFDDILYYDLPEKEEIKSLFNARLNNFSFRFKIETIVKEASGLCHADIVKICDNVIKDSIINDLTSIRKEDLIKNIKATKLSYERIHKN